MTGGGGAASVHFVLLILLAVRSVPTFLSQPWHVLFLAQLWRIYEEPEDIDWEYRSEST